MNLELILEANRTWENFVNSLSDEERKSLSAYSDLISFTNLHYLIEANESVKFDQIVNILPKHYYYDVDIVPKIYRYYIKRELHEIAFNYLQRAKEFIYHSGKELNEDLQSLINGSNNENLLKKLRESLKTLREIKPSSLPIATPDSINDKNNLSEFVLEEIVKATRVLHEKIKGIEHIPYENRYNDLLIATLRLRFQVWNWSIHDQSRTGVSENGAEAGEADLIIQWANTPITLIECFILSGKNKTLTERHLLKVFNYNNSLNSYYLIIFFKGDNVNFDSTWKSYLEDVKQTPFLPEHEFDATNGFEDLLRNFENVRHLRISKSTHGRVIEIFHIMINLQQPSL